MSAGEVANRSPLMALAKIKPALCARDQSPHSGRVIPRPHADTTRATPTTTQYAIVRTTVLQNIAKAMPYGLSALGSSGVVEMSRQRSSLLNGSTARRRVFKVVNARWLPQGMVEESAKGPAGIGQYVEFTLLRGEGGRREVQR